MQLSQDGFPKITLHDLEEICSGAYQLKCAEGYAHEHILRHSQSQYTFQMHRDCNDLLRIHIHSKHSNTTKYTAYIQFNNVRPLKIQSFCTCPVGQRTIGCCAHAASVIWYLGYARYAPSSEIHKPQLLANIITSNTFNSPQVPQSAINRGSRLVSVARQVN